MSRNTPVIRECRGCGCDFQDGTIATTLNKRFCHTCEFVYEMGKADTIIKMKTMLEYDFEYAIGIPKSFKTFAKGVISNDVKRLKEQSNERNGQHD